MLSARRNLGIIDLMLRPEVACGCWACLCVSPPSSRVLMAAVSFMALRGGTGAGVPGIAQLIGVTPFVWYSWGIQGTQQNLERVELSLRGTSLRPLQLV